MQRNPRAELALVEATATGNPYRRALLGVLRPAAAIVAAFAGTALMFAAAPGGAAGLVSAIFSVSAVGWYGVTTLPRAVPQFRQASILRRRTAALREEIATEQSL